MVAKTPDYIIADCGCPQWNTSSKDLTNFDTLKYFTIGIDKNKRLLPQRETVTDYYVQVLANKLNTWEAATTKQNQRETLFQTNRKYDDPSVVKHMKTQRNEAVRRTISTQQQQQQQQLNYLNSNPHFSDKRRRSRITTDTALDSDLDVF